jgi:hypothetical protein
LFSLPCRLHEVMYVADSALTMDYISPFCWFLFVPYFFFSDSNKQTRMQLGARQILDFPVKGELNLICFGWNYVSCDIFSFGNIRTLPVSTLIRHHTSFLSLGSSHFSSFRSYFASDKKNVNLEDESVHSNAKENV